MLHSPPAPARYPLASPTPCPQCDERSHAHGLGRRRRRLCRRHSVHGALERATFGASHVLVVRVHICLRGGLVLSNRPSDSWAAVSRRKHLLHCACSRRSQFSPPNSSSSFFFLLPRYHRLRPPPSARYPGAFFVLPAMQFIHPLLPQSANASAARSYWRSDADFLQLIRTLPAFQHATVSSSSSSSSHGFGAASTSA